MPVNELDVGAKVKLKTREIGSTLGLTPYKMRGGEGIVTGILLASDGETKQYQVTLKNGRVQIAARNDLVARHKKKVRRD